MADLDVNREELARRRERLIEAFGEAPVQEVRKTPEPGEFEEWVAMAEDGYIGSAYALIHRTPEQLPPLTESMQPVEDERAQVLLIKGRGGTPWGVPGGGQEGEEPFEETVVREVREEVSLEIRPRSIDHMRLEVSSCDGFAERLYALRVFFHADYVDGSIGIQPGELLGAAWFQEPPPSDRLLPSTERLLDSDRTT